MAARRLAAVALLAVALAAVNVELAEASTQYGLHNNTNGTVIKEGMCSGNTNKEDDVVCPAGYKNKIGAPPIAHAHHHAGRMHGSGSFCRALTAMPRPDCRHRHSKMLQTNCNSQQLNCNSQQLNCNSQQCESNAHNRYDYKSRR
eukprot:SAG25_NODE_1085_length_4076_cov_2.430475_3_plen_145_part_00